MASLSNRKADVSGPASDQRWKAMEYLVWDRKPGGSTRGWDGDGRSSPENKGALSVRWSMASVPGMLPLVPLVVTCLGSLWGGGWVGC